MSERHYRMGIDVGLKSVGLACIAVDDHDVPVGILNVQSVIHDGGLDPQQKKRWLTRKHVAGDARRARRKLRRRRERLRDLDKCLTENGYPLSDSNDLQESFAPWMIRAELADGYIMDDDERRSKLSIAIRHIARHRGWRNSFQSLGSMLQESEHSPQYLQLLENANGVVGDEVSDDMTPAQIVREVIRKFEHAHGSALPPRLRTGKTKEGLLPIKLMQSDNADELKRIFAMQHVSDRESGKFLEEVFKVNSPKGSSERLVGKDPFDHEPRASRASLAFQKYRIVATIGNLRIVEGGSERPVTHEERQAVFNLLTDPTEGDIAWADVAEKIGLKRSQIRGAGFSDGDDEGRVSNRPPRLDSVQRILGIKDRKLRKKVTAWWTGANDDAREVMISLLSNAVDADTMQDFPGYKDSMDFLKKLDDEDLAKLDKVDLPAGRSAYSVASLRKMTDHMLTYDVDLHEARKAVFGVDDAWRPAADPIGAPVGNPSVDRVLKIVNQYILACRNRWGDPLSVQIEHVRGGFSSVKVFQDDEKTYEKVVQRKKNYRNEIKEHLRQDGRIDKVTDSDIRRWEAIQRQDRQCLYCGRKIAFQTCEMDHIVPRKGVGSTNTRVNLAAVCTECNRLKGNQPFAVWVKSDAAQQRGVDLREAIERVDMFLFDSSYGRLEQRRFKQEVIKRLRRTDEDEAIDNRSLESVAWMADELHRRIDWFYNAKRYDGGESDAAKPAVTVAVFQGRVTAEARRASGIEGGIHFIGAQYKTRLDRRHHAVDASVIALMRPGIAQLLAERNSLRLSQLIAGIASGEIPWKKYPARGMRGYELYNHWLNQMHCLLKLLNDALDHDQVRVLQRQRFALGNAVAHDAVIKPLKRCLLRDALDVETVKRSSTPAQYCALTRLTDYDDKKGLPEDEHRQIRINGRWLGPDDEVTFFSSTAAQIAVRGGGADIGSTIHHARIYRCRDTKGKCFYGMVRVFQVDLLRHAKDDLFSVFLPPQSISMRYGEHRTVQAIQSGCADYLGYLVEGDTLVVDLSKGKQTGQITEFLSFFGFDEKQRNLACSTWTVTGFESAKTLRLRPLMLSSEGLTHDDQPVPESVETILDKRGWRVAVGALSDFKPVVIRTNALGEPRWKSRHGLPTSWAWTS